jgi:hypothetical protein
MQKGFSLIYLIVGIGISSLIALNINEVLSNATKVFKKFDNMGTIQFAMKRIGGKLGNSNHCRQILEGHNIFEISNENLSSPENPAVSLEFLNSIPTSFDIPALTDDLSVTLYQVGDKIGHSEIERMIPVYNIDNSYSVNTYSGFFILKLKPEINNSLPIKPIHLLPMFFRIADDGSDKKIVLCDAQDSDFADGNPLSVTEFSEHKFYNFTTCVTAGTCATYQAAGYKPLPSQPSSAAGFIPGGTNQYYNTYPFLNSPWTKAPSGWKVNDFLDKRAYHGHLLNPESGLQMYENNNFINVSAGKVPKMVSISFSADICFLYSLENQEPCGATNDMPETGFSNNFEPKVLLRIIHATKIGSEYNSYSNPITCASSNMSGKVEDAFANNEFNLGDWEKINGDFNISITCQFVVAPDNPGTVYNDEVLFIPHILTNHKDKTIATSNNLDADVGWNLKSMNVSVTVMEFEQP